MTENNVAAQAGDEPMLDAIMAEWFGDEFTGVFNPHRIKAYSRALIAAAQVSPRATADVEREKRQAERVERLVRAAKVYTYNYLQDEHEEAELCTCGPKQHAELVELFAALAAIATTKPGA